jgi:hypothetical protein
MVAYAKRRCPATGCWRTQELDAEPVDLVLELVDALVAAGIDRVGELAVLVLERLEAAAQRQVPRGRPSR